MQRMRIGHASRWMFEKVASLQRWQHWGYWGSSGTMCQMIAEVEVGGSPGQRPHRRPREQQHHDSENVKEQKYVCNYVHMQLKHSKCIRAVCSQRPFCSGTLVQQVPTAGVHCAAFATPPCVLAEQMHHYIRVAKNILP